MVPFISLDNRRLGLESTAYFGKLWNFLKSLQSKGLRRRESNIYDDFLILMNTTSLIDCNYKAQLTSGRKVYTFSFLYHTLFSFFSFFFNHLTLEIEVSSRWNLLEVNLNLVPR